MACISTKYTEQEIRDMLLEKSVAKIAQITSPLEKARVMRTMNDMVSTKEVAYEDISPRVRNALGMQPGETVSRYHLDNYLIASGRTTDSQTKAFIRSKGLALAREISARVDTIVKARGGEKVHWGTEELTKMFLESGKYKNLMPLSEVDGQTVDTLNEAQIKAELGISQKDFNALKAGVEKVLKDISAVQNKLDPSERAVILPEQFVLNPVEDYGGKVDLMVLFSDNTHGVVDYKTFMPPHQKVGHSNQIIDKNWIPRYKEEAVQDQITKLNQTINSYYASDGARISRAVPIHTRFKPKPKAQRKQYASLTEDIGFIDMGAEYVSRDGKMYLVEKDNTFIKHIPIGEQITLRDPQKAEKINKAVSRLSILVNNDKKQLDRLTHGTEEHTRLLARIKNREEALEKIILDQDFLYLFRGFDSLMKRITKDGRYNTLKNVDDVEIGGKANPDYLSLEELTNTINDIEAFHNIIESSAYFIEELNPDQPAHIYNDYLDKVKKLSYDSNNILEQLKFKRTNREFNTDEYNAMEDLTKPGFWAKTFRTLGEQVGVPFRKLRSHLRTAQDKKRIRLQKLYSEIETRNKELSELGKRIGKSVPQIFEMLINPKTENLWAKHNKEFYQDFEAARNNKDVSWLQNHLTLKKDARERYHRNLEVYKRTNPQATEQDIDFWKSQNSIDNVKFTNKWWLYYEPKAELAEKYYSDGFKQIRQHKELLNYWTFWMDTMVENNDLLGLRGSEAVPANFLPYIRQDIVGMMSQGTFNLSQLKESVSSIFAVRQDDTGLGEMYDDGEIDPITGKPRNSVPRFFINPIKDAKGNIRRGVKLRDLSKSLLIYSEMAYNYHYLKTEVEPRIEAIRDLMVEKGEQRIGEEGKKRKLLSGMWAKISGQDIDTVKLFDKYVDYHLYGVKIQDAPKWAVKLIGALKSTQSAIELSLSPLLWAGNLMQITSNAYFEGINGYYYDSKQMAATQAEGSGVRGSEAKKLYDGLTYLFEFSPSFVNVKKKNLSSRFAEKWVNWDTAFIGMRKSEQAVNNNIGISVLKNWTEIDGEVVRMEDAPEGTKSLFERSKIDNGYLQIEGITDTKGNVTNLDLYGKIRELAIGVATSVKGQLNPDDLASVYMSIVPNAAMGFKTWLPGMFDARLSQLRYDPSRNRMVEGKWMALATDLAKDDRSWLEWLGNVVAPSIMRLTANVATFGLSDRTGIGKYKINELRARKMFERYKEKFKHDKAIQNMNFEDYVKYKRGQIKATAAEIRMILALVGMVMALRADWDEDGEADWKKNFYTRNLFRAINRGRREVGFLINWEEWQYTIFQAPIPIMSLPTDAANAIFSAIDGVGDFVTGEERKPGERSKFYPALRMVPSNKLWLMFEPDEQAEAREV